MYKVDIIELFFKINFWDHWSSSRWKLDSTQHCIEALLVACWSADDSRTVIKHVQCEYLTHEIIQK